MVGILVSLIKHLKYTHSYLYKYIPLYVYVDRYQIYITKYVS